MKKLSFITVFVMISFIALLNLEQIISNIDKATNNYSMSTSNYAMVSSNPKMCINPSKAFFVAIKPVANDAWNQTSTRPDG